MCVCIPKALLQRHTCRRVVEMNYRKPFLNSLVLYSQFTIAPTFNRV